MGPETRDNIDIICRDLIVLETKIGKNYTFIFERR
jgi:hypothetical protein